MQQAIPQPLRGSSLCAREPLCGAPACLIRPGCPRLSIQPDSRLISKCWISAQNARGSLQLLRCTRTVPEKKGGCPRGQPHPHAQIGCHLGCSLVLSRSEKERKPRSNYRIHASQLHKCIIRPVTASHAGFFCPCDRALPSTHRKTGQIALPCRITDVRSPVIRRRWNTYSYVRCRYTTAQHRSPAER